MKNMIWIASLLFVTLFTACNIIDRQRIKGNGNITSKQIDLKEFSSIDADDNVKIILKQDPTYSVKVETDENLQQYLNIRVEQNKTLSIDYARDVNLRPTGSIKIYISAHSLDKIDVGNASELRTEGKFSQDKNISIDLSEASSGELNLRAPVIILDASEASSLTVSGECKDVKAKASEASTISAYDLKAENGDAQASEASTIHLFSSVNLRVNASEASTVRYKGAPNVTSNSREASSISKAD